MDCNTSVLNLGASRCKKIPQLMRGVITTPEDFTITAVNAATSAAWQTAILQSVGRCYLWPKWALNFENVSSEGVREDTPLASISVFPGQHRWKLWFRENLSLHKAMYSHRGTAGRAFFIDHEMKIIGTSTDGGTTLQGFLLDEIDVDKLMLNDGSAATKTGVTFYMTDNTELDMNGYMVDGSSFLSALNPLTSVNLAVVGTPNATTIVVSVKSALDNVPIVGLVVADFVKTGAGTISTATDANDTGVYTIAGTGFVTGTIDLVSAATLSLSGYES